MNFAMDFKKIRPLTSAELVQKKARWGDEKHFSIDFYQIEGSYLFPFEKPFETARLIEMIAKP
jgi:hypothetical protein